MLCNTGAKVPTIDACSMKNQQDIALGVTLARRAEMGNRDACLRLMNIIGTHKNSELFQNLNQLIPLIDKTRNFEPLTDAQKVQKIELQKMIPTLVEKELKL